MKWEYRKKIFAVLMINIAEGHKTAGMNNNKPYRIILLFFFILVLFCSCGRKTAFEHYYTLADGGWHQNEPVVFEAQINDTVQAYDLMFHIRHNVDYHYRNLWVFADVEYPGGKISRDTIEFIIGDSRGNWLGNGIGKVKEDHILLNSNVRFIQSGIYRFTFYQAMREEDQILENINSIGLSVVQHE